MRALTLERTLVGVLAALVLAIAWRVPADTDTWWHLRSGEYTLSQGMIYADPFSHTLRGQPWINHSWGAQLAMVALYRVLGDFGLALWTAGLAIVGVLALYSACQGHAILRGFVLVLAAAAAAVFWAARPQMVSFAFSALFLALLYRARAGQTRLLFALPALMILWGNLHAGHAIGFLFMLAFGVGEALNGLFSPTRRTPGFLPRLALTFVLCGVALLISPYGLQNALVPFQTVGMDALRAFIQEWNSPNFQGRETWPFIGLIVMLFGAAWASRAPLDAVGFLLVSGTLFLALLYGRNIAVFAVACAPLLSHLADSALRVRGWSLPSRRPTPRQASLNLALLGIVWAAVIVYALGVIAPRTVEDVRMRLLPVRAAQALRESGALGQLFNSYNWGGYLVFFAPEYPVFIDGRTDLYGDFLYTYLDVATARTDWRAAFQRYGIRLALIETGSGLAQALADDSAWVRLYGDDLAVLYQLRADQEGGP
ncbi:MAG: hypothetical protein NZ750_08520 [Anaerolineae bacterium]|nr:hypothetical protein [Anaerolineae bacterium]MDW8172413.1 hypothetical protein [Anaerolineae bacterium]